MPATHDHPTRPVRGADLNSTMVLVGESGGLSAIYDSRTSSAMPGLLCVETEHGPLYLDPDETHSVLNEDDVDPTAVTVLGALVDAENANQRAMLAAAARKGRDTPPAPTLASTLDSWRQMPDHVRDELYPAGHDQVEATLTRLVAAHGAGYLLADLA